MPYQAIPTLLIGPERVLVPSPTLGGALGYNTNTGRLTTEMFESIFAKAKELLTQ